MADYDASADGSRRNWLGQAWAVASDVLIATALIWAVPLLLGAIAAIVRLVLRST